MEQNDKTQEIILNSEAAEPPVTPEQTAAPEQPAHTEPAENAEQTDIPDAVPAAEPKASKGISGLRSFLCDTVDLAESVITAIFTVMLIFTYLVCTANVEGDSMVPTLDDGDRLLVSRLTQHYETGDILILNTESAYLFDADGKLTASPGLGKTIVKRLTAQSGQTVDIDFDAGIVYVDGTALDEPYINTLTKRDNRAFSYPLTVPDGYIFVLGDNRHISKDSRHPEIGLIPEENIIGKVLLRITPLAKFGTIDSSGGQQTESQRN